MGTVQKILMAQEGGRSERVTSDKGGREETRERGREDRCGKRIKMN